MRHNLLMKITAKRPVRRIDVNDAPYLERYYMGRLFGVTFYLHRFRSSDSEPHLHNHPWKWGRSLVLAGSYIEERVVDLAPATLSGCLVAWNRVSFWSKVNGNDFHRIASAKPDTWTLFMHGERQRVDAGCASVAKGWGFLEKTGDGVLFTPAPANHQPEWWHTADTREIKPMRQGRGA